jgi:hypothetical protein
LAGRLEKDSIDALRASFGRVEVRDSGKATLGGLPTTGALVAVTNKRGDPAVIQLSVSRGRQLAYVTQVVFRSPPCEEAAPDAQRVTESLEFTK